MIRTAWVWLNLVAATMLLAPVAVISGVLGVTDGRLYDWIGRTWSAWILRRANTPVHLDGVENVSDETPHILVGNHQSWFDVWAVASVLRKRFYFVAKKELERIPIFGQAWKAAGHISIDRGHRAAAIESLERAGQQLREDGGAVVVFAEGTRSPTDDMLPFKKGAFMLAIHTGVPIVPFGIAGTRRILPKGGWRVKAGPIMLRFGDPIPTDSLTPDDRGELIAQVRSEVGRLREQGRALLEPGLVEGVRE